MSRFRKVGTALHCLQVVSGILDARSYTDLYVIPTFQKGPATVKIGKLV